MNPTARPARKLSLDGPAWSKLLEPATVGQDVLELVSTAMYVEPLTIFREYIQNSADAADEAQANGLNPKIASRIDIELNQNDRAIRIRDFAGGISAASFVRTLTAFGASEKRGRRSRGFRGIGRLAGLGYCRELTFRSRHLGEDIVSELKWDCVALKRAFREGRQTLNHAMSDVVSIRTREIENDPLHFFEVEMNGIVRHRDDRLLNTDMVTAYLSEVGPVRFEDSFPYHAAVSGLLRPYVNLGEMRIRVNSGHELRRPHRTGVPRGEGNVDEFTGFEDVKIDGLDGQLAAVGWIAHHGYRGAIKQSTGIRGLRFRAGNIQVGDDRVLESLFREQRFNSWAVGEIHVLDPRVLPNGRRDNFEESSHLDNLINHLSPATREISHRCRHGSQRRKRLRDFELHEESASHHLAVASRGVVGARAKSNHLASATRDLVAMEKILDSEAAYTDVELLRARADAIRKRLQRASAKAPERGPLSHFKPVERRIYEKCFEMIFECAQNRVAAASLVNRILAKITEGKKGTTHKRKATKRRKSR